MPETEPKPKLIELVAPGGAQGWKAVLKSGKPAVVHEIQVPQAEAVAAAPRLQRLFEHRHPALSPVLAWGTDANGVWVAVEPNEGTPLSTILSRGPLTPPAAATLGAAVLSGVAALHEAGIAMGGFGATAVRVTSNGEVRLAGHPAAAVRGAPSQSDLRADVRSCGMAVCAAFGVDPAGAPAPPNIPPGLVVTMRSMASGAMGPSADRAQGALREMAAALLAPDRGMAAQSELATRSGGREVPPITPFLPPGTVAPEPRPSQPVPAAAAPAPAPAPYIAPQRREETPVRAPASYDAPDRPVQTYPSIPAVTFPPVPAPPPPLEPPVAPSRPIPAVPTWSEPPAASAAPEAPVEAPAAEPELPKAPTWDEPAPVSPVVPAVVPAVPSTPSWTAPPTPPAPPPPVPAPAPSPPAAETWTPVEQPAWKPGEAIPAEPLGTGVAVFDTPRVPTAPPPSRTPTVPPPVRRPTVPRPPVGGGGILADRPPWLIPAAVAVVIILLLGIVGIKLISSRGTGSPIAQGTTSPSAHASGSPSSKPSASPSGHTPQAVPTTFGPSSADPVKSVQICTAASPCNIPGSSAETGSSCDVSSCKLEVALYFTAVQKSTPVSYIIKFFDRCSGQTTDLPGATDHLSVSIPSGVKSGAIVAVSQTPAVAASAPLLIGGDSC
jgi:hypothetical protein